MPDHSTLDEMPFARERSAREIEHVLEQEMMSRRFITNASHRPRFQRGVLLVFIGVLLLLVLQQIMASDPATQIAHQQRAVSATGAIAKHITAVLERHDP